MLTGHVRIAGAGRSLEWCFGSRSRRHGPFKSWEDTAVDALLNCVPCAALNRDWSIGGTLTKLEENNGLG
jgi:lysozyme family protein